MKVSPKIVCLLLLAPVLFVSACKNASSPSAPDGPPNAAAAATFNRDVLPILQQRCQVCHRSEGMAPMELTNHAQARPFAKAMQELTGSPDTYRQHPGNDMQVRPLTEAEIQAISNWAQSEAP